MSEQSQSKHRSESAPEESWLIVVRHTAVVESLRGICYGASDVALSADGQAHMDQLATQLAAISPSHIFHSGLSRARCLAELTGNRLGCEPHSDPRIAEFNFGEWELRSWDDIYADGHDIARLIHEPKSFAPPGGETVLAMRDRIMDWYSDLPSAGRVLAISHGGPISVLRGSLSGMPPASWPTLVPGYGEQFTFELPNSKADSHRNA